MDRRRSVRAFSPDPVPRELIEIAIRTASTAPSGAHRQPWKFVVVGDPGLKREIRAAAEAEEYESYVGRPHARGVAGGPGAARHRLGEALPGDRPLDRRRLRGAVRPASRTAASGRTTTPRRAWGSPAACSSPPSTTWASRRSPTPRARWPSSPASSTAPPTRSPSSSSPSATRRRTPRCRTCRRKGLEEVAVWYE